MDNPLRILLLEDRPSDADLMEFELKEAGLTFISKRVMTEDAFLRELEEFCPDLILSDYDLPQYTGILALSEAKIKCPDVPFILVTGAIGERPGYRDPDPRGKGLRHEEPSSPSCAGRPQGPRRSGRTQGAEENGRGLAGGRAALP